MCHDNKRYSCSPNKRAQSWPDSVKTLTRSTTVNMQKNVIKKCKSIGVDAAQNESIVIISQEKYRPTSVLICGAIITNILYELPIVFST